MTNIARPLYLLQRSPPIHLTPYFSLQAHYHRGGVAASE